MDGPSLSTCLINGRIHNALRRTYAVSLAEIVIIKQYPKVATCLSWHQLFAEFQTIVHTERAGRACLNPIIL